MAREVNPRPLTPKAWVLPHLNLHKVCGGQSENGTDFLLLFLFPPVSNIPPVIHNRLNLHIVINRKRGRSLGNLKKKKASF